MPDKMIRVQYCVHPLGGMCPLADEKDGIYLCMRARKQVGDERQDHRWVDIPSWCPLEDVPDVTAKVSADAKSAVEPLAQPSGASNQLYTHGKWKDVFGKYLAQDDTIWIDSVSFDQHLILGEIWTFKFYAHRTEKQPAPQQPQRIPDKCWICGETDLEDGGFFSDKQLWVCKACKDRNFITDREATEADSPTNKLQSNSPDKDQQPDDDIIRVGDTVECIESSKLGPDEVWGIVGRQYRVKTVGEGSISLAENGDTNYTMFASRFKKVKPTPKPTPEPELWICENAKMCKEPDECAGFHGKPHQHEKGCDVRCTGVLQSMCIPYKPEPVKDECEFRKPMLKGFTCYEALRLGGLCPSNCNPIDTSDCCACLKAAGKCPKETKKDEYGILDMYKKVIHPEVLAAVKEKYLYTAEKPKKKRGRPKKAKAIHFFDHEAEQKYSAMRAIPCGKLYYQVSWADTPKTVTCRTCLRLMKRSNKLSNSKLTRPTGTPGRKKRKGKVK